MNFEELMEKLDKKGTWVMDHMPGRKNPYKVTIILRNRHIVGEGTIREVAAEEALKKYEAFSGSFPKAAA